jgi:hypothetical protein
MTFKRKVLLFAAIILGYSIIVLSLSKVFLYDYSKFGLGSFFIYMVAGYVGAYRKGFWFGVLLAAITGFIDSTVGWYMTQLINPFYAGIVLPPLSIKVALDVVLSITGCAALMGLIGASACKIFRRTKPLIPNNSFNPTPR